MNKNFLVFIIISIVIIGAVAWFSTDRGGSPQEAALLPTGSEEATNTNQKGSLKSLLAVSTPQQCTFMDNSGDVTSEGTIYAGGGKMRGDFNSVASGKTMEGHLIVINDVGYVWSSELP